MKNFTFKNIDSEIYFTPAAINIPTIKREFSVSLKDNVFFILSLISLQRDLWVALLSVVHHNGERNPRLQIL